MPIPETTGVQPDYITQSPCCGGVLLYDGPIGAGTIPDPVQCSVCSTVYTHEELRAAWETRDAHS